MSDIMTRPGTAMAAPTSDAFDSFARRNAAQGTFLTFKNGEFLYGTDGRSLPLGTRLAANMQGMREGWRKWSDTGVVKDLTEPVIDRVPVPSRDELGDMDQSLWRKDREGRPLDPWQLTVIIDLVDDKGETFVYGTGSWGGRKALGNLTRDYGKLYRQRPGFVPIVELGNEFYMHKEHGKTYNPIFKLVDWASETSLEGIGEPEDVPGERIAPPSQGSQRVAPPPVPAHAQFQETGAQPQSAGSSASTTISPSKRARF